MMWLFQNGLKIPPYHWFPPGYTSKKSFAGMLGAKVKHNMKDHFDLTYEELLEERYIIVGSPETVIERLTEFTDDLGAGIVLGAGGHMGSMPHWLVMKNTYLMAETVIPHFREPDGKPSWMRADPLGPRRSPSTPRRSRARSCARSRGSTGAWWRRSGPI